MSIRIEAVAKRYGNQAVLQDMTLEVQSGELLTLLGASGSGKTTLLRILAGLERADALTMGFISTPMRDAVAFTLLILVLLVRPTGIFGEPEPEKA